MFEIVTSILSEGPICDDCLGRQFAKCSTNLTNKQRGQAIRIVKAMLDNTPVNISKSGKMLMARAGFAEVCSIIWIRGLNDVSNSSMTTSSRIF